MGQEAGQGVAESGERWAGKPRLEPAQPRPQPTQLVVMQSQPRRLHLLLPSPLGAPVLEPNLQSLDLRLHLFKCSVVTP